MKKLINSLLGLIEVSRVLGLNENNLENAKDYLVHNEYELCFDTIITQMYEYDIEISNEVYNSISRIGKTMNLQQDSYSFMKELIRNDDDISNLVED
ncbi:MULTISPECIES: MafI family immunity protein [unclassified Arcicella]|uniref:MafI family immunity protein n=1 Tax=unclassified Arcicella TaxID=2644986 RepID=UPI00285BB688|nr:MULTISPECIES: MafI family immunity protein [unclassified Arcicella]MDR6563436.1 hypothetical protein [Arcicella sp. BE51]MDR6813452.1 hypothetical protein [Arcicella sp. BE140]MDR6824765.1 hypothetical protein [Arcicella sp. BE139]